MSESKYDRQPSLAKTGERLKRVSQGRAQHWPLPRSLDAEFAVADPGDSDSSPDWAAKLKQRLAGRNLGGREVELGLSSSTGSN
jgi:hypothetical protein